MDRYLRPITTTKAAASACASSSASSGNASIPHDSDHNMVDSGAAPASHRTTRGAASASTTNKRDVSRVAGPVSALQASARKRPYHRKASTPAAMGLGSGLEWDEFCTYLLLAMISAGDTTFVENSMWRLFFETASGFAPPTMATVHDTLLPNLVAELRQHMRELLRPVDFVSITVGGWNGPADTSFVAINVAWIDVFKTGWPRQLVTLTSGPARRKYPAANLASRAGAMLKEYGLDKDGSSIQWATSDSAASNVVKCFKDLKLARYPRICQPLHRVITTMLKEPAVARVVLVALGMLDALVQSREWAAGVTRVPPASTKWESTYNALVHLVLKQAEVRCAIAGQSPTSANLNFEASGLEDDDGNTLVLNMQAVSTDAWWNSVEAVIRMLKPLKVATAMVADDRTPTIGSTTNTIIMLRNALQHPPQGSVYHGSAGSIQAAFRTAALQHLDKAFPEGFAQPTTVAGVQANHVAMALDPRVRRCVAQPGWEVLEKRLLQEMSTVRRKHPRMVLGMLDSEGGKVGTLERDAGVVAARMAHLVAAPVLEMGDMFELALAGGEAGRAGGGAGGGAGAGAGAGVAAAGGGAAGARHLTSVHAELKAYVGSHHQTPCPFSFWSQHAHRYPTLATLAYKLLPLPPSTAPSKTVYCDMSRKLLGDMILLKQNMDHLRQLASVVEATNGGSLDEVEELLTHHD